MPDSIRSRIFCDPVSYPTSYALKYTEPYCLYPLVLQATIWYLNKSIGFLSVGYVVAKLVEAGRLQVRVPMVSLEFFIAIIIPAAL